MKSEKQALTSAASVSCFTLRASLFPLVNSSVKGANSAVHEAVSTMFHEPLLLLLVLALPLFSLLSFVLLESVCGACWSQALHLISLLRVQTERPALGSLEVI